MATTTFHDLKLVGNTSSAGGQFRHIKITGESVLSGDVAAESIKCVGEMEIKGNLQAQKMRLTGECKVHGNLQSDSLEAIGDIQVASIRGNQVKVSGHIKVEQSCEVETLKLRGWLEVGELISAEQLQLDLFGVCRAQEIGGGTITVMRSHLSKIKSLLTLKEPGSLEANLIEGDVVHLEHVTADVVRGTRVTIGTGCKIGRAEYRESLEKHPKAEVGIEYQI
jgi:cytoskeletal protein CcmA (bactofilin family)